MRETEPGRSGPTLHQLQEENQRAAIEQTLLEPPDSVYPFDELQLLALASR